MKTALVSVLLLSLFLPAAAQTRRPERKSLLDREPDVIHLAVGSSRVDLQACKLEYSIVSPK